MKKGKVSNSILKRSVLKEITMVKDVIVEKPHIGADAGMVKLSKKNDDFKVLVSSDSGIWPIYNVVNNIASRGGVTKAIQCNIIMPETNREIRLRELMSDINSTCKSLEIAISGGHTQVLDTVLKPVVCITGIGEFDKENDYKNRKAMPGQDIIITKWIGIGGIRRIIEDKRDEISSKYIDKVIDKAYGQKDDLCVVREAKIASENGVGYMHDVSQGGIFAALWDMAEQSNVGIEVDFRKIPVKQEIIEICEMYDINPYEFESCGCLLMTSDDGCGIINVLNEHGISASIIGKITNNNDKIIHNLDELRYLDTPKVDEIYRFI